MTYRHLPGDKPLLGPNTNGSSALIAAVCFLILAAVCVPVYWPRVVDLIWPALHWILGVTAIGLAAVAFAML